MILRNEIKEIVCEIANWSINRDIIHESDIDECPGIEKIHNLLNKQKSEDIERGLKYIEKELDGSYIEGCKDPQKLINGFKRYMNEVTNVELKAMLDQCPDDAVIAVEYCNPKSIRYVKDTNTIHIN